MNIIIKNKITTTLLATLILGSASLSHAWGLQLQAAKPNVKPISWLANSLSIPASYGKSIFSRSLAYIKAKPLVSCLLGAAACAVGAGCYRVYRIKSAGNALRLAKVSYDTDPVARKLVDDLQIVQSDDRSQLGWQARFDAAQKLVNDNPVAQEFIRADKGSKAAWLPVITLMSRMADAKESLESFGAQVKRVTYSAIARVRGWFF